MKEFPSRLRTLTNILKHFIRMHNLSFFLFTRITHSFDIQATHGGYFIRPSVFVVLVSIVSGEM